jgi:sRNA-binding regulator protein Hfq
MARQVVSGQKDLNTILQTMANEDRVQQLQTRHGLNRALACQVVQGAVDLEKILLRKRLDDYRKGNPERSVFEEALRKESLVTLGLHGRIVRTVRVVTVLPYEIDIQDDGAETVERVHKTRVKYAYAPDEGKVIRRVLGWDKELKSKEVEPILRPQDRFDCSDRWLFRQMEQKTKVSVTLLEGEQFQGTINWLSRYEFGLMLKGGAEITLFRHSLASAAAE